MYNITYKNLRKKEKRYHYIIYSFYILAIKINFMHIANNKINKILQNFKNTNSCIKVLT